MLIHFYTTLLHSEETLSLSVEVTQAGCVPWDRKVVCLQAERHLGKIRNFNELFLLVVLI